MSLQFGSRDTPTFFFVGSYLVIISSVAGRSTLGLSSDYLESHEHESSPPQPPINTTSMITPKTPAPITFTSSNFPVDFSSRRLVMDDQRRIPMFPPGTLASAIPRRAPLSSVYYSPQRNPVAALSPSNVVSSRITNRTGRSVSVGKGKSHQPARSADYLLMESPLMKMSSGKIFYGVDVRSVSHFNQTSLDSTAVGGSGSSSSSSTATDNSDDRASMTFDGGRIETGNNST